MIPQSPKVSPQAIEAVQPRVVSAVAPINQTPKTTEFALRLTIDQDKDTGTWLYKALDPITGEVVKQFPREELINFKRSSGYEPGSLIKTKT